ncbi:MAG TPA: hypothetical protein PK110_03730 [Niabella sp.]|nr:hypothetical protein [Niabella sp.]
MPWKKYAGMNTEDILAIYAYLQSVKQVAIGVDKFTTPKNKGSVATLASANSINLIKVYYHFCSPFLKRVNQNHRLVIWYHHLAPYCII